MKWQIGLPLLSFVGLAACASTPKAAIASVNDIGGCEALGEVVAEQGEASNASSSRVALQEAAAEKGATHVVPETAAPDGAPRGQMYACATEGDKSPTRSRHRLGF